MTDLLANVRTGDWLDAQHFPPMRWAVHGILPEGFGLLTGAPKAGKSWAAFGIALAVASGGNALGRIPTGEPRPVFMLALEDGDRRLQGRARHLLGDGVEIPRDLHYVTTVAPGQVSATIGAWLDLHGSASPLIVLDTLGKVAPPPRAGESAYAHDYRTGSALKALADAHPGTCLIAVHHTRKMSSDDWMDSTSGTNGLNGAADFTVSLSRSRNEASGVLRVTGRDVAESEYAIRSDNGRWSLEGSSLIESAQLADALKAKDGLGDRSAEIVAFVTSAPAPVAPTDVESALGISEARRYLARLTESGRITRLGRGKYWGVPSVPVSQEDVPCYPEWDIGTDGTDVEYEA